MYMLIRMTIGVLITNWSTFLWRDYFFLSNQLWLHLKPDLKENQHLSKSVLPYFAKNNGSPHSMQKHQVKKKCA